MARRVATRQRRRTGRCSAVARGVTPRQAARASLVAALPGGAGRPQEVAVAQSGDTGHRQVLAAVQGVARRSWWRRSSPGGHGVARRRHGASPGCGGGAGRRQVVAAARRRSRQRGASPGARGVARQQRGASTGGRGIARRRHGVVVAARGVARRSWWRGASPSGRGVARRRHSASPGGAGRRQVVVAARRRSRQRGASPGAWGVARRRRGALTGGRGVARRRHGASPGGSAGHRRAIVALWPYVNGSCYLTAAYCYLVLCLVLGKSGSEIGSNLNRTEPNRSAGSNFTEHVRTPNRTRNFMFGGVADRCYEADSDDQKGKGSLNVQRHQIFIKLGSVRRTAPAQRTTLTSGNKTASWLVSEDARVKTVKRAAAQSR
ncbi:hypothetical protein GGX14DRAFT_391959 [Mycena pura]|uniref:Uncharacterized protein n=1 Tax=Mycena pura TaxID=153505 RepID=A0AAD6VKE9_9AGAR|nr:hypothetical protein GGX14DRAFT_391959 [Mycena pura]